MKIAIIDKLRGLNMKVACNELVEQNIALVGYVIKEHFYATQLEYDDMFQCGCEGLLSAAKHFVKERGEFRNYAYSCIYYAILSMLRLCTRHPYPTISLQAQSLEDDDLRLEDTIQDLTVDVEGTCIYNNLVDTELKRLDKESRQVIALRLQGYSYQQIANKCGISKSGAAKKVYKFAEAIDYMPKKRTNS